MPDFRYKIGLRLARLRYVRRAINDRANLEAFKERPTFRIFAGMFLIAFSFVMCWPAISALGTLAIYFHRKWILVGAPVLYVASHGVYIAGMALAGERHLRVFFRWATRVGVEKLLSYAPPPETPPSPQRS